MSLIINISYNLLTWTKEKVKEKQEISVEREEESKDTGRGETISVVMQ